VRKSKLKRTMSMLLTVLMVFMSMNFSVFAEELTAPAGETTNSVEVPAEQSADEPAPAVVAPTPVDEETGTTEENATDNSLRQERPALLQAPVPNGTEIAKIDDQEYTDQATFLTAFNAMTGSHTVQLLEDIDLGNIATNNAAGHATANDIFTVQKDADITLDLNGHKITGALKSNGSNYGQEYIIGNFGTLTIQDASSAKTGVIENTTNTQECLATLRNQYDANLTIEGGTIKATIGNAISNYGKAIVYSGTIQTTAEKAGGWENGSAAIHNRGSLTIAKKDSLPEPIVSTSNGIPVWVSSTSDGRSIGNAKISAGTYTTKTSDVDVKIESGAADASIVIEGGIWDKDPSAYVGAPYVVEKKDSKYSVRYGYDGEKNVSSYSELENALKSVGSNWVDIKLSENITVTGDITIPEKAKVIIPEGKKLILSKDRKLELKGKLENNGILDISQIGNGWVNDISHLFGSGTIEGLPVSEAGVYKISTINQFQFMHYVLMNGKGSFTGTIELQKDIDAANYNFVALGDYTNNFAGNFNGNNKVLKNLTINSVSGNGSIFNGVENASFLNLNIENCNIQTTNGMLGLLAAATEGNIIVKDVIISGSMRNATSYYSGGLIGTLGNGTYTFENCNLRLSINGFQNVGTFWGSAQNRTATVNIINCSNSGDISSTGSYGTIGGFGYGPVTVNVFGYNYTGVITVKGQKIDTPKLCTKSESDQFIIAAAREKTEDKQYKYYETIEEAVANAADNAVIEITPGTYNLSSTLRVNKPLTLKGLGDVVITRGDAWTPEEGKATDSETGTLILIEKTNDVTLENLTVQGARKITGSVTANGHGINIVQAENVTLNNVTSKDNAAAGIVVNGSTVTASGLYTSGNGWYGVNVDQGSGITDETIFTLDTAKPYKLSERLQIVSDKFATSENIYVNADGFAQRSYMDGEHEVVYWVDEASLIKNTTKNITYTTIQEAISDATRGNTIEIPAGIYSDTLDINKSGLTLKKAAGDGDCVLDGTITISSKNVNIQDIKAGDNAKVAVKKDASLILKNATGFGTDKKITVEKLFGEAYDTGMVKLDGIGVAKDKLGFTYLGEKIQPDGNALTNALGITDANAVTYTVKTPAQFYWLSQQINKGAEGFADTSNFVIKLGANLDFNNDEWLPVGTESQAYKGSFDGQGHSISNLYINIPGQSGLGLFGVAQNNNTLGNVTFNTVEIYGSSSWDGEVHRSNNVGALVGKLSPDGTVQNVKVDNFKYTVKPFDTNAGDYVGGIVGTVEQINMSGCDVNNVLIQTGGQNIGGAIGYIGSNATVQDCSGTKVDIGKFSVGGTTKASSGDAGGLIGTATTNVVKVYNCSIKDSTIWVKIPLNDSSRAKDRGELVGEMRSGTLYLYNCTSENTTALNMAIENDQSQLVGGDQDKVKTLTVYNEDNKTPYATISEAVKEANSGDTITIGAGTYDETVTLDKAVTLVGPYADTAIKAADATAENRPEATEAVITGGININRTDTTENPSIKISGLKFKGKGIEAIGWGSNPQLDSVNIENNVFADFRNKDNIAAIHFNLSEKTPAKNLTIHNNRITSIGDKTSSEAAPSGINIDVVEGTTTITDNYIDGTNHSSLQMGNKAKGDITITGNTFKDWDQNSAVDAQAKDPGGRAVRLGDFSEVTKLTMNQNKMIRNLDTGVDKDEMVKFTKVPADANVTFDLSFNYWNGKLPVTTYGTAVDNSVIVVSEGGAKVNAVPYYTDEAMTTIRVPATVYGTDGQEKGQYLTIQEAVNAAEAGETVQLTDGVYTETVTLKDQVTLKGADSGNTVIQCTIEPKTSPDGNGENAAVLLMQNNITAKVENVAFDITKTGQSPISFNTTGSLTIEGCRFTGREGAEYGTNAIYGGGNKDATVIFKDNTFEVPYRMAITSLGKDSVVTGNTFNIGTDRVGKDQRTSVLTVVAQEGTINISNNIFAGANRAIGVDHSSLSADKLTIKNNQFIDVRYGFELGSDKNKTCGTYDLSKNYYAQTDAEGTETVSAMLVEDADKSGSHFDDTSLYTGNQVKVYPYYKAKTMTENDLYAPVELVRSNATVGYFGTITDAFRAADNDDTVVVNQTAEGTAATIAGDIDMNVVKDGKVITVNLQLEGSTTFTGNITGTSKGHLILNTAKDATEATTATFKGNVDGFVSVDTINFDAAKAPVIKAGKAQTDNNSFISKTGVLNIAEEGEYRTWTYTSPSDHFNGGNGTQAKPYQINTADQLKLLAKGNTKDMHYKLTNDITVFDWVTLASFAGNFNGNGYTITGNNVNFIDTLAKGAKVEKLRFEGFTNLVNTNNGTVENCYTLMGETGAPIIGTNNGTLESSYTSGPALVTNTPTGVITNSYYTSDTAGENAKTKAEMQKAQFAITLNKNLTDGTGAWYYDNAVSAYPVLQKNGSDTPISALNIAVTPLVGETTSIGYAAIVKEPDEPDAIYANDTVKVKATVREANKDTHYFDGWYINDVKVSRDTEATIQVKADCTIEARFVEKAKSKLVVTANGAGRVLANGKSLKPGETLEGYAGSQVTLTVKPTPTTPATTFSYWLNGISSSILSEKDTYTYTFGVTDSNIIAVFFTPDPDYHQVIVRDNSNTILSTEYYNDGAALQLPEPPELSNYDFVRWYNMANNETVTNETKVTADMIIKAEYKKKPDKVSLTVANGTIEGYDKTSVNIEKATKVSVKANDPKTGEYFAGWIKTGDVEQNVISKDVNYSFYIYGDTSLTAIYSAEKPEEIPYVTLTDSVVRKQADNTYRFVLVGKVIPYEAELIEYGFVYKTGAVANPDELVIGAENAQAIRSTKLFSTMEFNAKLNGYSEGDQMSFRSYMIYSLNGQQVTVYSNEVGSLVASETQN